MQKILIESGDIELIAELNDSETAQAIYNILPVSGPANVWGDEIYFSIPMHMEMEPDAKQEVDIGDLGFWPVGDAFCIFFGKTPVSINKNPRAYSPVNVFGRILGDAAILRKVSDGEQVKIRKEE